MSGTSIATAAIPSNLGQPHRYGFQSSMFTLKSVTARLNANIYMAQIVT